MSIAVNYEDLKAGDDLLGQLEYYEAILGRKDLIAREGEFRSCKLGLTIELLGLVDIPENLKMDLVSAIIDAWRLDIPERSVEQRDEELKMLLQSIEAVKYAINWVKRHPQETTRPKLDVAVMFSLPLTNADLRPEGASRVHSLLCQVMDHYWMVTQLR